MDLTLPSTPFRGRTLDTTSSGRPHAPVSGNGQVCKDIVPQKDADGKYPCPHCNKTCLHAAHLKRHLFKHTGYRPYSCHLCKDTFSRSDILKRHFQKCSIRRRNQIGPLLNLAYQPTTPFVKHTPPGSRASSVSSVRSMIDDRLEQAHQERIRSASRDHSVPPSPFLESSPFHAEFVPLPTATHVCECCPEAPQVFDSLVDLRSHIAEKQYSCAHCPTRFKDKDLAERHLQLLHTRFWSCAALSDPKDAFCESSSYGGKCCGYCGFALQGHTPHEVLFEHIVAFHKIGQCDVSKKFIWADDFYQHLKHSHGASCWSNIAKLEAFCETVYRVDDPPPSLEDVPDPISTSKTANVPHSPVSRKRHHSSPPTERIRFQPGAPAASLLFTSMPNPSEPSSKRKACVESREKKSKCDGLEPCGRCEELGLGPESCAYEDCFRGRAGIRSHGLPNPPLEHDPVSQEVAVSGLSETGTSTLFDTPPVTVPSVEAEQSRVEFVCPTCERSFTRRTILANHQRSHTGEKPFSCQVSGCEHKFAQQSDKTRHEQAQHTEKTFKCGGSSSGGMSWGCGKPFRRKDGLLEHHRKTAKGRKCLEQRNEVIESDGI